MRLLIVTSSSYQIKHDTKAIRRLHEYCLAEKSHPRSKSCELYREAVDSFNRDMDEAVDAIEKKNYNNVNEHTEK